MHIIILPTPHRHPLMLFHWLFHHCFQSSSRERCCSIQQSGWRQEVWEWHSKRWGGGGCISDPRHIASPSESLHYDSWMTVPTVPLASLSVLRCSYFFLIFPICLLFCWCCFCCVYPFLSSSYVSLLLLVIYFIWHLWSRQWFERQG